jgi:hypothetical protein
LKEDSEDDDDEIEEEDEKPKVTKKPASMKVSTTVPFGVRTAEFVVLNLVARFTRPRLQRPRKQRRKRRNL